MSILGGGILGGGGQSSGTPPPVLNLGGLAGEFTSTTVRRRAFTQGQVILYDNGTNVRIFRASTDIPVNSPVPGSRNSLWRRVDTETTTGITQDELTAQLRSYVRQSDYNIKVASLDSRDTDNRNSIQTVDGKVEAVDDRVDALKTEVDDLPTDTHLSDAIQAVDDKFGGVPINGPAAGGDVSDLLVTNLNKTIPPTSVAELPVFSGTNLIRGPSSLGPSTTDLQNFDRILIRIAFVTDGNPNRPIVESFDFFVNIAEWLSLNTVPYPTQTLTRDPNTRASVIASAGGNIAVVHEFPQKLPNRIATPTLTSLRDWFETYRGDRRLVYVGRANESAERLLVGISGMTDNFLCEVKGYH